MATYNDSDDPTPQDFILNMIAQIYGKDGELSKKILHIALIAVGVVILQISFQFYIFQCPEENYKYFSLFFFIVPSFPLFCIGWLSNADFQKGITGICHRCWNKTHRQRTWSRVRWRHLIGIILTSHINAYVAPFFWFLSCLLNGRIVTCYEYGPPALNPTDEEKKKYLDLKVYSKMTGFDMLLVAMAVLSVLLTVKACFKKANPGIEVKSFEVLDNYASYEAGAACEYFEEIMKEAAQKNGRRKVDLLMEANGVDLEHLEDGLEKDIQSMSYEPYINTRNSLMQVYPNLYNAYDCKLQYYTIDEWHSEEKAFRRAMLQPTCKHSPEQPVNYQLSSANDEKVLLLEMKEGQHYQSTTT